MIFGHDVSDARYGSCLAKFWKETNIGAAFQLTVLGTQLDADGISQNSLEAALYMAKRALKKHIDELSESSGSDDIIYAATKIATAGTHIHKQLLDLQESLGQGIYLVGSVLYFTPKKFMIMPFGGASCYTVVNSELKEQASSDRLFIRDALGGSLTWTPQILQGNRGTKSDRLILISVTPPDIDRCEKLLRTTADDCNHPSSLSMLLRRELEQQVPACPIAVMEIHF